MSADRKRCLRRFLLAAIYMLGVLGIVASGGGGGGDNETNESSDTTCILGSAQLGDCKLGS